MAQPNRVACIHGIKIGGSYTPAGQPVGLHSELQVQGEILPQKNKVMKKISNVIL